MQAYSKDGLQLVLDGTKNPVIGGKVFASGGVTFEPQRSAVWLGVAREGFTPDMFFKLDGSLEHPSKSHAMLGQPYIDFHDGAQHGTAGAPTITGDLAR